MNDLEMRFRAHLITLIVNWLLKQGGAKLLTTTATLRTPYGQLSTAPDGRRIFTPRQANLVPGMGGETLVIESKEWQFAVGDSGRYKQRTITPSRGGGAFPVPTPYQPAVLPTNPAFLRKRHLIKTTPELLITFVDTQNYHEFYFRLYRERFYHFNGLPGFETLSADAQEVEPFYWEEYELLDENTVREEAYMTWANGPCFVTQAGWELNVWEQVNSGRFNTPSPYYDSRYDRNEPRRLIVRDFPTAESFMVTCEIEPLYYTTYSTSPDSALLSTLDNDPSSTYYADLPVGNKVVFSGTYGDTKEMGPIELEFATVTDRWRYLGSDFSNPATNDNGFTFERQKATWGKVSDFDNETYLERTNAFSLPPEGAYTLWGSSFYSAYTYQVYPTNFAAFNADTDFQPFTSNMIYLREQVDKGMLLRAGGQFFWITNVASTSGGVWDATLDRAGEWDNYSFVRVPIVRRKSDSGSDYRYRITEKVGVYGKGVWFSRLNIGETLYETQLEPGAEMYRNSYFLLERQQTNTAYPENWERFTRTPTSSLGWTPATADPPPDIRYWPGLGDDFAMSAPQGEVLRLGAGSSGSGKLATNYYWTPADTRRGQYVADRMVFEEPIDAVTLSTRDPESGDTPAGDRYIWWPDGFSIGFRYDENYEQIYEHQLWDGPLSPRAVDIGVQPTLYEETLSAEAIAEIDRYRPYLYDDGPNWLASPLASPQESSWYGLVFGAQWFVADVFVQDVPEVVDGVSAPVPHTFAVAITDDGAGYSVRVSRDEVDLGTWDVFAFFPPLPEDGKLRFLDGSPWPPDGTLALKPEYEWAAHPGVYDSEVSQTVPLGGWPQKRVGYLPPFTARIRTKEDKYGPKDCPLVLFLETP